MKVNFNGRRVQIERINHSRFDSIDSYIESAYYLDDESDLTDSELDELTNECSDVIHQDWWENKISEAEFLYEE